MLQNWLDSAKGQVLRAESGHSDTCICKTRATAPSPSSCLSRSPVSPWEAHQDHPQSLPNHTEAKAINSSKIFWHLQHKHTSLKASTIPASLFASPQSNYRRFNDLRHFSSISSCTLPSLQPSASAGGAHCNELIRKTQRYESPQHAPALINASFGACSHGEPELRKLHRNRFHCKKSGFRQVAIL